MNICQRIFYAGAKLFGPKLTNHHGGYSDDIDEAGVVAALVALGAKMAKADGSVSKSEVDAFKRVFQASPENEETIGRFFNLARQSTLGYEKYAIAGGDWGAVINRNIANTYPDRLIGLHTNMVIASPPEDEEVAGDIGSEEGALLQDRQTFMLTERGYHSLQETKPQTAAYGLTDSPAGLAGWILEKFHGWSDVDAAETGRLSDRISHDKLLTNIAIYWFNQNIDSSMRIYYENRVVPPIKPISYIDVPTGVSIFPNEIYISPRSWVQAGYDLRYWNVLPSGGHFAALEEPVTYVNELNAFFGALRDD